MGWETGIESGSKRPYNNLQSNRGHKSRFLTSKALLMAGEWQVI